MIKALRRHPAWQGALLASPAALFLIVFFLLPFLIVVAYSLATNGGFGRIIWLPTLENYARVFDPLYFGIGLRSAGIALATTLICLLLGYPLAYFIAGQPAQRRNLLLIALLLPFWTNFLVRTYALMTLLREDTGLINLALMNLGLIREPLPLFGNDFAILLGMVYGWLPAMVLPCYAAIERLDKSLLEAARDLYARDWHVFWRVAWPLTLPGVVAGSILVFIPSLGAFIVPAMLGGGKTIMLGNVINSQFLSAQDWPFGSALSVVMIAVMLAVTLIYFRISRHGIQAQHR